MSYAEILGQEEALQVLKGALASGRPGHAYLFHGAEGVGKTTAAVAFAQALNCERGGPEACGDCLTCRRAAHGNLRDIETVLPGSKSGQTVEIDQVRDLIARAATRPTEGRRKVFLLPQAHRLSPPAMQTLLKTLEEPPDYVTLILETRELTALLPTILSRCQTVRFRPLETTLVERLLRERKIPDAKARVAAAYARGSVGVALQLATDPAAWKRREQTLDLMASVATMSRPHSLRVAEDLHRIGQNAKAAKGSAADATEPEEEAAEAPGESDASAPAAPPTAGATRLGLAEALRVASAWYGDLLALSAGAEVAAFRNPDRAEALRAALAAYSTPGLHRATDALLRAEYHLGRNANPRLLCETLAMRLCPS